MARQLGDFNFAANLELLRKAPLDARMLVSSYENLVDPATWISSDGNIWLFNGAIVVVSADPSSGVYWLKDSASYTDYASWIPVGTATPFDPTELYQYIDGSLAARDSSISELYSIVEILDSSIGYLLDWKIGVDASIIRIDSSLNVIFDQIDSLDASIVRIDSSLVTAFDQISSLDASIVRIDSSLNILSDQVSSLDASIVRIDSSLVTAFDHLVSLDASVDELRSAGPYLKEASIGDGLVWVDGQLDVSVGSVSGESIDGGVWITNITPTSGGNVGDKSYSSDGVVLDYCLTDTSALTVHVLALPGHTNYKPVITINGDPVTISAEGDKPLFSGTYNIQYDFADASITVLHEDGAHWSTIVDADEPAEILSAVFIGGYPGSQTELKAGDTFDVSIMTDVPITGVILEDYGAFVANTFVVSGTNVRITGTIANRGTTVQDLGFSIKVVKSTGSTSASYLSENYGSTDGTYLVKLNNLYPSVAWGTITYPGTQLAIKSPESATAVNTASNYDTISYSSPNGQLTITNPTTYESPKTVTYLSGTYNVSTQNLRVTATRAANNASSIANTVISIANSPATLTVTNPAPRLRSGGNDGTAAVNHTITIGSNQRLLSAPDLTKDTGGTWVETEFTWSPNATSFTRSLQVHDDDAKATYDWKAITATNLAGIVTTTWSGATTYTLGGFVVRTVNLDPFAWQGNINVAVSDYTKLSSSGLVSNDDLVWTVKTLTSRSTFNDTSRPQAEVWSASGTLLAQPTTINILDKPATDSASVPSSFTIQEGI